MGTPAPTPAPTDVLRSLTICFGAAPAGLAAHSVALPAGSAFDLGAITPDGSVAYGQLRAAGARGIGRLDLATGALTRVVSFANGVGGAGWMAVDPPWLAWYEADSITDAASWSIHARNESTGAQVTVATSALPGGGEVYGQLPTPVVRNGMIAWAQPQARQASYALAEVRVMDLASGRVWPLAAGRVSAPVFAGADVVWAHVDDAGRYGFQAVDAASQRPVALPPRLSDPGPVAYLAGSDRYLAWSDGPQRLTAWKTGTRVFTTLTIGDVRHPLQFLQLAGDELVWYAGYLSAAVDLRTGGAFDVRGMLAGSASAIAASMPARVESMPLTAAPPLSGCAP